MLRGAGGQTQSGVGHGRLALQQRPASRPAPRRVASQHAARPSARLTARQCAADWPHVKLMSVLTTRQQHKCFT